MEKDLEVVWTNEALERLADVYLYLRLKWSATVADRFQHSVALKIRALRKQPYLGPISDKKVGLRKILLTPHNYLLYQVEGGTLYILNIIDTRQKQ